MAQRVRTILISDLSGDEVEAGGESVSFSYRGTDYVIDLTAKEAAGFDKAMARYVDRSRKGGRTRSTRAPSGVSQSHRDRVADMKAWATQQGLDYPKRGRLPKSLVDAYDAAH